MIDDFENDANDPDFVEPEISKTLCNDKYRKATIAVLDQIKDKLKSSTIRAEKIQLLTLAPKSWSRRQLMVEFKTSERQANNAKELVAENGILTLPNPRRGRRPLSVETEAL